MQIILTHEQADFDAIASLLGAFLLNERATPVLPRRMNRNVRAFLTLYGSELPFVDPRDMTGEMIKGVTLVDTQSLISVKGMAEDVSVHVIDHHPLREDLPPNWVITVANTGANTTLFVETLREKDSVLGTVNATLLLLGIYEDTGSLTYDRTTSRDLMAASFLLDQGANLQIAGDFLNHPLSANQHMLYEHLKNSTETLDIHGNTIIIAHGDTLGMDEELSSIAHKLRDLLDPDALFLLVTTRSGVQMIARSMSDSIDVGEITTLFGGGGHERAAASLIKDRELTDIKQELIKILPDMVRPVITVAQIMSREPQMLSADTPVNEALLRMQRFGYEGFPVVKDGKLVGLLTRRAVDRAIAHKLNLTAYSLMEAGEHIVYSEDSIERLQNVMTETGWGQIPVVNPNTGEIIGIVTRTDLLKTLTPQPRILLQRNLSERLEKVLPEGQLALLREAASAAFDQQAALFIVGGFVRDLLLDRPSLDFDLVVEGDAIKLARTLANKHGGRVTSHSRFGTAKWHLPEIWLSKLSHLVKTASRNNASDQLKSLDLVSARTEFYTYPTALPTVQRGSIKLDLHRRDFTINTLALRLDGNHYGELHDYWGGLTDLRQGLVRVLHSLSFVDDPTRILRAVRFEQRFDFSIEERTLQLMDEAVSLLDRVSGDRIRHELDHILIEE
ncbi:MAG TPA: CBS domain-containing protein, partial [Anaerolineales bacterium]|nr:CBS domain-containing protein [Anaerolineales bacterium]